MKNLNEVFTPSAGTAHEIENDLGVVVVVGGITSKKVTDALPPLSRAGGFFPLLHVFLGLAAS